MEVCCSATRLYGDDPTAWGGHDPQTLLLERPRWLAAWFVVGTDDHGPLTAARTLDDLSRRAGVASTFVLLPGGHSSGLVHRALVRTFATLADTLASLPGSA